MKKGHGIKQTRPFQCVISAHYKRLLKDFSAYDGIARGFFFDTSGKVRVERVNPSARYSYLWRTDGGGK